MSDLLSLSAEEQLSLLRARQLTPQELTALYLEQIERHNDALGALTVVTAASAMERAQALATTAPSSAPLWGMPQADKDLVQRSGVPTGFGSRAGGQVSTVTDPIAQLADDLGMVSLGKTNTPEFGFYGYTESAVAPPARHPLAPSLGAGGSSGGAATAVAAHMLPWAIGSDGGGSVRIPAATVGLVGLKPTLGRLGPDRSFTSITGVVNGPITRSVRDAALLFYALADGSGEVPASLGERVEGIRFAATADSPWDWGLPTERHPQVLDAWKTGIDDLRAVGLVDTGLVDWNDEHYADTFKRAWWRSAASLPTEIPLEALEPVTRYFVERGRALTPAQVSENQSRIEQYRADSERQWGDWDILVTPALGLLPQPIGSYGDDPEANFAKQVAYSPYTSWVNLTGRPAITVPVTTVAHPTPGVATGPLPLGIQLVGRHGSEPLLLDVAYRLEQRVRNRR